MLIVGTTLTIISALSVRGIYVSPEATFGLSNYMPLSFWIGFVTSLCGAYLLSFAQKKIYQLFAIFCVGTIVCLTPYLVETLPHYEDAYWHFSTASYISETGHLNFTNPNVQYLQYPGAFIVASAFETLTSIDKISFLQFFPILETSLWIISFYALASAVFESPRKIYLATIVSVAANVFIFRNDFSPSGLAAALFPLLLFLMLKSRSSSSKKLSSVYILAFFFLVITHPIFPLIFIAFVVAISIYEHRFLGKTRNVFYALLFLAIYFSWNMFVSTMATQGIVSFFRSLLSSSIFQQFMESYGGSYAYVPYEVSLIRRVILLSFAALAFYYILRFDILKNRFKKMDRLTLSFLCTMILAVVIGLTSFGAQLSARALCLVIPLATLVILKLNDKKFLSAFVLIALLVFPIFTFSAYYFDESRNAMYLVQYTGLAFMARNLNRADTLYMDYGDSIDFFTNQTERFTVISHLTDQYDYSVRTPEIQKSDIVCYLISSFANYFYLDGGTSQNSFIRSRSLSENSLNYDKIYDDWGVQVFKRTAGSYNAEK
jgi:hypothetical protein